MVHSIICCNSSRRRLITSNRATWIHDWYFVAFCCYRFLEVFPILIVIQDSVSLATIYAVPLEQIHPFHRGLIVADYSKTSDSWEKGRWSRLCQEIDDQLLIVCGVSSIFEESMEPTTYIWKSVVAPNFAQGSAIFKLFIIYRLKNGFVQLQPEWNCRAHQREKTFIRSSQE